MILFFDVMYRFTYRQSILCMYISKPLYVVEYQPRQGYDHQNNKRDGDK